MDFDYYVYTISSWRSILGSCRAVKSLSNGTTSFFWDRSWITRRVVPALAMSFVDLGFLSWAILGTLGTIVLMYAHYHKGMPLKPRAFLYPIFGEKIM